MIIKEESSWTIKVYIAGDYADAVRAAREFCEEGACFCIQPADYVYTGGAEAGIVATLINYPRFPSDPQALLAKAERFAEHLRSRLFQDSYTIETPALTYWHTRRGA